MCKYNLFIYMAWYSSQVFMVNKTDNMHAGNAIENAKDYIFK